MSRKDHWAVIKAAERRGWRVEEGRRRHVVLIHPSGVKVFTSGSPSHSSSCRELERDLRHVEERGYVRNPPAARR